MAKGAYIFLRDCMIYNFVAWIFDKFLKRKSITKDDHLITSSILIVTSVAPEPRLGSVLARALDQKAQLGSARAIFQKARIEKNWQNEPIDSTHQDKSICTLEYMVWRIRTSRNLPLKLKIE